MQITVNHLFVNTSAQKILMEEMVGQITDGMWENTTCTHDVLQWCNVSIEVDPAKAGRWFNLKKEAYRFNSTELVDLIGDRLLEKVQLHCADSKTTIDYSHDDMRKDLAALTKLVKTYRVS